jgi:glutamyl-tRNA synthetase
MITRFAPTPSGFLHTGNAANALLVAWLADQEAGTVTLRIDDVDATRARPEYVADVFHVLEWLGIDVAAVHSQSQRRDRYWAALEAGRSSGLVVYACTCSRSLLRGPAMDGCPAGCRTAHREHVSGVTALRVLVPAGTLVPVGEALVDVAATSGDFVVWRRDDLPAYHLTSVVDDHDLGVTHIVRGSDLLESTAAQLFLAKGLGLDVMDRATVLHHDLIRDSTGAKLSKSQMATGHPMPRDDSERARLHAMAATLGAPVGIRPPG